MNWNEFMDGINVRDKFLPMSFGRPQDYVVPPWACLNALSTVEPAVWRRRADMANRMYSSELAYFPTRPGNLLEHYSLLDPVHVDKDGNRWLDIYFDMRSYKPEEISVTMDSKENCLHVEAHHEIKDAKDNSVKRSYARKIYLGHLKLDFKKLDLKSSLSTDGLLCVEAALPRLSPEELKATSHFTVGHLNHAYSIPTKTV